MKKVTFLITLSVLFSLNSTVYISAKTGKPINDRNFWVPGTTAVEDDTLSECVEHGTFSEHCENNYGGL